MLAELARLTLLLPAPEDPAFEPRAPVAVLSAPVCWPGKTWSAFTLGAAIAPPATIKAKTDEA